MVSSFFEGVTVDLFWGTSTLGEPALTRAFQAGAVTFDTPPGVTMFAARVNPAEGTIPGLSVLEEREYGFPVQPGKTSIEGSFILRDSLALSVDLATSGGKADPEKALITALALDCRGLQLRGAQYELIDGESGEPVPVGTSPGQPRPSYVQYGLPSTTCEYTSPGTSAWMLIDAPVNVTNGAKTHAYRVRLKGRKTESDAAPVIIGEREVELFPGILSYVQVHRLTSSER
jgi:hypothetical protein